MCMVWSAVEDHNKKILKCTLWAIGRANPNLGRIKFPGNGIVLVLVAGRVNRRNLMEPTAEGGS